MEGSREEFAGIVTQLLARFFDQMGQPFPADQIPRFVSQLAEVVAERGLPRALTADECGAPGSMSEQECAPLIGRVMEGVNDRGLTDVAKQLVKTCFYPEFKTCRDSFREVARDGSCRRQELARVRGRISGTHCVDCPHWVSFSPESHADYLAAEWRSVPELLVEHRAVFLPEDFRALRRWLYSAARRPKVFLN